MGLMEWFVSKMFTVLHLPASSQLFCQAFFEMGRKKIVWTSLKLVMLLDVYNDCPVMNDEKLAQ